MNRRKLGNAAERTFQAKGTAGSDPTGRRECALLEKLK